MKRYPLIIFTLIYIAGIILAQFLPLSNLLLALIITAIVLLASALTEAKIKRRRELKSIIQLSLIFAFSFTINSLRLESKSTPKEEESSLRTICIEKTIYQKENYSSYLARDLSSNKKIYLEISNKQILEIADIIVCESSLSSINNKLVIPFSFNFDEYLKGRGIQLKASINNFKKTNLKAPFYLRIQRILLNKINQSTLSEDSKGMILALSIGNKSGLDKEIKDSFSNAGIMHLLALSGLHLGILSFILLFILNLIFPQQYRIYGNIIVVIILFVYAYITGFSPSILRASIMFGTIIISKVKSRKPNIYNSISFAALILLLINPNYIFDIGFQLSFSAVLAIVSIYPLLSKMYQPKLKVLKYFYDLALVSIAAQIGTAPFTIFYFHKFTLSFLLANLIEIPLFTLLLSFSYLQIVLFTLNIEFQFINTTFNYLVELIVWSSDYISSFHDLILENILISEFQLIASSIIISTIVIFFHYKKTALLYLAAVLIIALQLNIISDKNADYKQDVLIANGNFLIHDNNQYITYKEKSYPFSSYINLKKLKLKDSLFKEAFIVENSYFLQVENLKSNSFTLDHNLIVNNKSNINPNHVSNSFTKKVILNTRDKTTKERWQYFCLKNDIIFFNSIDSLYREN